LTGDQGFERLFCTSASVQSLRIQ